VLARWTGDFDSSMVLSMQPVIHLVYHTCSSSVVVPGLYFRPVQAYAGGHTSGASGSAMKSLIEIEVHRPQSQVATLMADPMLSTKWMDDLERVEPISGEPGMPGSKYRLVPKRGKMVFVVTVDSRDLPKESRLTLDSPSVSVSVNVTFRTVAPDRTILVSEEVFRFKGLIRRLVGFFASGAIRKAHRKHIEAFKRYAEQQV
jgi:polyketide cyclase/dehydrase/lipid transport protein